MVSIGSQRHVVLDACVLAPMPLCDTLLRLAEEPAFYIPKWSDSILSEVARTISKFGYSETQVARRMRFMRDAFPEAVIECYEHLFPALGGVPDHDRHVIAAAIHGRAATIVSFNTRHFPKTALEPFDLECITPDEFLVQQYHADPQLLVERVHEQAAACGMSAANLACRLESAAPNFARLLTVSSANT